MQALLQAQLTPIKPQATAFSGVAAPAASTEAVEAAAGEEGHAVPDPGSKPDAKAAASAQVAMTVSQPVETIRRSSGVWRSHSGQMVASF